MVNRWGNNGNNDRLYLFNPVDGDSSHKIETHLLLERKAMTNLDNILKSRDITLPTKVRILKAMVFPLVVYGCASWTIKKSEPQRIDAFELWCWRKLLRVPWTARRSNQEINPEYWMLNIEYWCWSSNTLATFCEKPTHWKRPWCWERLKAGREGNNRGWAGWMASPSRWKWVWAKSGRWWNTGNPGVLQSMESPRVRPDWAIEQQHIPKIEFLSHFCIFYNIYRNLITNTCSTLLNLKYRSTLVIEIFKRIKDSEAKALIYIISSCVFALACLKNTENQPEINYKIYTGKSILDFIDMNNFSLLLLICI